MTRTFTQAEWRACVRDLNSTERAMPVEHGAGGTTLTGAAIPGFGVAVLKGQIKLWVNAGLRPTRHIGPRELAAMATQVTGRKYTSSKKSLTKAIADLETIMSGKSLDEVGQVVHVQAAVGGIAADLPKEPHEMTDAEVIERAHEGNMTQELRHEMTKRGLWEQAIHKR